MFFCLVGVVCTVWVPPRFDAKSTIILPSTKPNPVAGFAQSLGLGISSGGGEASLPMFKKILESERILDIVSSKSGIDKKLLRKSKTIDEDPKGGSLEITVNNADPKLALSLNRMYLEALRQVVEVLMIPSKGSRARLLKSRLDSKLRELSEAEDRLESFSKSAQTSPISEVTVSTDQKPAGGTQGNSFRYREQLTTLKLELERLDARIKSSKEKAILSATELPIDVAPFGNWRQSLDIAQQSLTEAQAKFAPNSPEIRAAERKVDALQKSIHDESERYLKAVSTDVAGSSSRDDLDRKGLQVQLASISRLANVAPQEATQYRRLVREVAILSEIVTQLTVQNEQAQLDRSEDPNRWEILDEPHVSDDPVNKNYFRNVGLALLLGVFLGCVAAQSSKPSTN